MDRQIERKKNQYKSKLMWAGGIMLVCTGIWFFTQSFQHQSIRISENKIQTAIVTKGNFEEYITVTGIVEPEKTMTVVALSGGIVQEVFIEDGGMVKEGDLLFRLSNQELELDFMNRETALLDQLNNLRNTEINLENTSYGYQQQLADLEKELYQARFTFEANGQLMQDSLISKQEFEISRSNYQSLEKRVNLLRNTNERHQSFQKIQSDQLHFSSSLIRKSLESLRKSLEMLDVRAPASGLLTGFDIELGASIQKGQKVAEVDLQKGYLVKAAIDEIYISRVNKGLKGIISFSGNEYLLELQKVYPQVNNGQFQADFVFSDTTPTGIKYGQSLQTKLSLGEPARALLLKRGGFYQKTGGNWVFVLEGNKALKRSTSIGRQNPDFYEITHGLQEGDEVIISSYSIFGDAEEVVVE